VFPGVTGERYISLQIPDANFDAMAAWWQGRGVTTPLGATAVVLGCVAYQSPMSEKRYHTGFR
jgi:hypothetical protein